MTIKAIIFCFSAQLGFVLKIKTGILESQILKRYARVSNLKNFKINFSLKLALDVFFF
jgi:hypothetical protein